MVGGSGRVVVPGLALAAALLGGACVPVTVGPAGPPNGAPPQVGPTLVLQVSNRSPAMLTVGYEFEAQNASGGGEGGIEPCQAMAMGFGEVAGHYRVLIGGEAVGEGDVPPGFGKFVFMIVDVTIDADGEVEARPHRISRVQPPVNPRTIADCG